MSRNLLNRSKEFVGLDQKFWTLLESAYGDLATGTLFPSATNAIGHVTGHIEFMIPREDSQYRSGRSVVTRLSKKKEVKWGMETYIVPGAPDGSNHPTLPDAHPMLLGAFGAVDQSIATQIQYKLGRASTSSFRLLEEGTHFSRLAVGCVCDGVTFMLPGDGKSMMKFEGFGQDAYISGQATLASNVTASNTLPMATGLGGRFEVGSYIQVISASDGNTDETTTPRLITAISGDNLTINGAPISAVSGDFVIGAAPSYTPQGAENALLGLSGSFTTAAMGLVDCQLLHAEIMIKNNFAEKKGYYGTSKICGFIADKRRSVSIKLEVLLTRDNFEFYMNNKKFLADNVTIVLGPNQIPAPINAPAGRTFTFNLPKVEFNVPKLEQPADGFVKLALEGTALATDINTQDNEITLTIT